MTRGTALMLGVLLDGLLMLLALMMVPVLIGALLVDALLRRWSRVGTVVRAVAVAMVVLIAWAALASIWPRPGRAMGRLPAEAVV